MSSLRGYVCQIAAHARTTRSQVPPPLHRQAEKRENSLYRYLRNGTAGVARPMVHTRVALRSANIQADSKLFATLEITDCGADPS